MKPRSNFWPKASAATGGVLFVLWGAPGALALESTVKSGPVEARLTLLPDSPRLGDALSLTLEVVADSEVEVLMPEFGEALDRFQIIDFVPRETVDSQGRTIHTQRYTLSAPNSGNHTLPPLLIEFIDQRPEGTAPPEGQDAHELLTESAVFSVASVLPETAGADLHPPMKALMRRSPNSLAWGWFLAGGLLALGILLAAWKWRGVWARTLARDAGEVAKQQLAKLLAGPRPDEARVNAFYVALSGIVRSYIENRFSFRAPELTTEHFLELLSDSPDLGHDHQNLLREFLRNSDLVKFAHHIPSPQEIEDIIAKAQRFIEETAEPDARRNRKNEREVRAA